MIIPIYEMEKKNVWLVGGAIAILKKLMEFVNGKDDIPYMKWKITHVWNHQPDENRYRNYVGFKVFEHL